MLLDSIIWIVGHSHLPPLDSESLQVGAHSLGYQVIHLLVSSMHNTIQYRRITLLMVKYDRLPIFVGRDSKPAFDQGLWSTHIPVSDASDHMDQSISL